MQSARWLRRVPVLFLAVGACSDPTAPSTIELFDKFWTTFDRNYSYFEYKGINWDSLRTIFRPRALNVRTEQSLVTVVLKDLVASLRDRHVWFIAPDGSVLPTYEPVRVVNWNHPHWTRSTDRCAFVVVNSDLGHCRMDGIGYMFIRSWNDRELSVALLDAVVDQYRDVSAMIIDVRPNGGGADDLPLALAGRFAARETTVGYIRFRNGPGHADFGPEITRRISPRGAFQFTKPVIVLAGRGVLSASETFISAMRELPAVTILGDITGGSSGNPARHRLGDWSYMVPRWIEWTADRRAIEWMGIPPDVSVRWDADVMSFREDPLIWEALNRLVPLFPRPVTARTSN